MLGLTVEVSIDQYQVRPQAQNVLNELDGVGSPLGIYRVRGEKTSEFKQILHGQASVGSREPGRLDWMLGLEARREREFVVFENVAHETHVVSIRSLRNKTLQIDVYEQGTPYIKTTHTFDLLDRGNYPFLDELVAAVTVQVEQVRAYVYPFTQARDNSLLPEHLTIGSNRHRSALAFPSHTRFFADVRWMIPDTISIREGNLNPDIAVTRVNTKASVSGLGDWWTNYATGEVVTGSVWSESGVTAVYESASPLFYLPVSRAVSLVSLSDPDTLHRAMHMSKPVYDEDTGGVESTPRVVYLSGGSSVEGRHMAARVNTPLLQSWLSGQDLVAKNRDRFDSD